jgi:hypothetical protein
LINSVCLHFYLHQDFGVLTPARCGLRHKGAVLWQLK